MADGGETPVPRRLSRSVIDSVGPAGAEFARNASASLSGELAARVPAYLKRGYGWDRTRLDGSQGAAIWCGHGVFTHNLVKIAALAS